MSRLYGVNVDKDKWEVQIIDNGENNYESYKVINKETSDVYFLKHLIGLEQVTDNEFLIYRRYNWDDFEIQRCLFNNSLITTIFSKKFSNFNFITDDRIMFTSVGNDANYRCDGIYSIKHNNMVEEGTWLNRAVINEFYDDKILTEIEICSYRLGTQKLIFAINPNTLEPNSECYSSLRDSFIKVKNKEDIEKIKQEDRKYIDIISEFLFKNEQDSLKNAKEKIKKNTK